jgi:hypothetical protein
MLAGHGARGARSRFVARGRLARTCIPVNERDRQLLADDQ